MPSSLVKLLRDKSAAWTRHAPASEKAIARLIAFCDFSLPNAYLTFLRFSNGGEGPLSIDPWWFQLYSAEKVIANNKGYNVAEFLPGYLLIGSSGGGEMLVFRKRDRSPSRVYMVPFITIAESDVLQVCRDFEKFVMSMGKDEEQE